MRRPPRLMPALITPFTRRGEIDRGAHAANVETLVGRGVRGFLIAGSTGEGPYLEPGERAALVAVARQSGPRAYLVCGVAAESVRGALSQAAEAAEGGADALLVITPTSLVRGDHALVARFYEDVTDRALLPVLLYTVPKVTGYELPAPTVAALATRSGVAGIKDSGGQPVRIPQMLDGAPEGFSVFAGATPALALSVAAGAWGGITASANYAFPLGDSVVEAARRSPGAGRAAQERLTRVAAAVERHGIGGVKAAAAATGLAAGTVRSPLSNPSPAVRRAIAAALAEAGLV